MANARSVRIDGEIVDAAATTAAENHRSMAEQVNYWAAVGRRVTSATGVDQRRLDAVVAGDGQFAALTDEERVVAHARVDAAVEQRVAATSLGAAERAAGVTTVTLDDDGQLVEVAPDGTTTRL